MMGFACSIVVWKLEWIRSEDPFFEQKVGLNSVNYEMGQFWIIQKQS